MTSNTPSDERRTSEIKQENRRTERTPKERPERGPDPDTLEGPGDRQETKRGRRAQQDHAPRRTLTGERPDTHPIKPRSTEPPGPPEARPLQRAALRVPVSRKI
jgi:hypothetical protein